MKYPEKIKKARLLLWAMIRIMVILAKVWMDMCIISKPLTAAPVPPAAAPGRAGTQAALPW